jgi:hypothetical protein
MSKVDNDKGEESEESEGKEESKEAVEGTRGGADLQGLEKAPAKDMLHAERGAREESGGASPRKQAQTPEGSEQATNHLGAKMMPVIKEEQRLRLYKSKSNY